MKRLLVALAVLGALSACTPPGAPPTTGAPPTSTPTSQWPPAGCYVYGPDAPYPGWSYEYTGVPNAQDNVTHHASPTCDRPISFSTVFGAFAADVEAQCSAMPPFEWGSETFPYRAARANESMPIFPDGAWTGCTFVPLNPPS